MADVYPSIFTRTVGRLNKVARSAVEVMHCPNCGHRMFDAYFIGVLEVQCRRCKKFVVVASKGPDVQAADTEPEAVVVMEPAARVFDPHD